jgi:hypothetical protein
MDARSRRKIQMGQSVLQFSNTNPDPSAGYAAALARLADRLNRAEQLASQQLQGLRDVRVASARKVELRRVLKTAHLPHVAQVGKVASREAPELAEQVDFRPGSGTFHAFRTGARSVAAEAQAHKEVLIKHGLAESVLDNLMEALDQFDAAVDQGLAGRQTHVGASAELRAVADEIVEIVRVMDGLNRYRFMNDAERLAAWESASNIVGPPKPDAPAKPAPGETPPADGEVRAA